MPEGLSAGLGPPLPLALSGYGSRGSRRGEKLGDVAALRAGSVGRASGRGAAAAARGAGLGELGERVDAGGAACPLG